MEIYEMLAQARNDAHVSQAKLAKLLDVDLSTVKRWENGETKISLEKAIEGFNVLGISMYPYLIACKYPNEMSKINNSSDIKEVKSELNTMISELDDFHIRELLLILKGAHGSSPTGMLDLMTAYLHLPLFTRLCVSENVLNNYELYEAIGKLENNTHIYPATATLRKCHAAARQSVIDGKNTYSG